MFLHIPTLQLLNKDRASCPPNHYLFRILLPLDFYVVYVAIISFRLPLASLQNAVMAVKYY